MSFKLKTKPAEEPVTLGEAKKHLRVGIDDEDGLIHQLIQSSREHVETLTRRPLVTQTWMYYSHCLANEIELKPNLQSVVSIKYLDNNGVQQTIDPLNYETDPVAVVGLVYPAYNKYWPEVRDVKNSVEIEFIAGYGEDLDVPSSLKSAMLLLIGNWFENRESILVGTISSETPMAAEMLIKPYKVITF